MSTVVMHNVVSVDGFIADAEDQVGPLFDWYANGEVAGLAPCRRRNLGYQGGRSRPVCPWSGDFRIWQTGHDEPWAVTRRG